MYNSYIDLAIIMSYDDDAHGLCYQLAQMQILGEILNPILRLSVHSTTHARTCTLSSEMPKGLFLDDGEDGSFL